MKIIEIKIENDSLYNKLVTFLKSLKISFEIKEKDDLDFSKYQVKSFKNVDALEYQKKLRDEW